MKSLGQRTKHVMTQAKDEALVVATPTDGNCLITALLRGLHGGQPLSTQQEHDGMLELRRILSEHIKQHNWPHPDVANPQTIDECVNDVATEGQWCGEVAMAAFATLTGSEIRLWRYPNDNKDESVIEPLMKSGINEGPDRQVIHLLQTRAPRNGRPEFASHWESIIMKPSVKPKYAVQTAEPHVNKDGSEEYDWIVDPGRKPPLRLTPWVTAMFKGRGQKKPYSRIICQIKRVSPKVKAITVMVLNMNGRGKTTVISKPLTDVMCIADKQASVDEIKEARSLFAAMVATVASKAPTPPTTPTTPTRPKRKASVVNAIDSDSDSDSKPQIIKRNTKQPPKKKSSPKVKGKVPKTPIKTTKSTQPDRISQLENEIAEMKTKLDTVLSLSPTKPSIISHSMQQSLESSSKTSSNTIPPSTQNVPSFNHAHSISVQLRLFDLLQDVLAQSRDANRRT